MRLLALVLGLAVVGTGTWVLASRGDRPPLGGGDKPAVPRNRLAVTPSPLSSTEAPVRSNTVLVWMRDGLPQGFSARVAALPGVAHSVAVVSGTVWLTGSVSPSGEVVDRPPAGMAIPLELAGADPSSWAWFVPTAERTLVRMLTGREALLGEASSRLGPGGVLRFGSASLGVSGVVPDTDIGDHEAFVSRDQAARLGVRREVYMLVAPAAGVSWREVAARIRRVIRKGEPALIAGPGEAGYVREAPAVLPPVFEKALFGEFAAVPTPGSGGDLRIDPAWVTRHIETVSVPILGRVTCNRAMIPLLRGVLGDLARRGLAPLINVGDFGGCYVPRLIAGVPGNSISHHAWGTAIDINVAANPFGDPPDQDSRLVAEFEKWGFTWGGRWLVPDGMHFEILEMPVGRE